MAGGAGNKTNRTLAFGAGPPDYGQTVFNPDGRANRDAAFFYDASTAGTVQTEGWDQVPFFTWPDAASSSHWTFADAFRYILGHYNAESWVTNGAFSAFSALSEFAERVPDSFTINGMSIIESVAELAAAAGLTVSIEVDETTNPTPTHQFKFWSNSLVSSDNFSSLDFSFST